jgi:hypothetical protein
MLSFVIASCEGRSTAFSLTSTVIVDSIIGIIRFNQGVKTLLNFHRVNTTFLSYWLTTLTIVKNRKMMINNKIRHILL